MYFLGILITGVTLITEMCENSSDTLMHFKKVSCCPAQTVLTGWQAGRQTDRQALRTANGN